VIFCGLAGQYCRDKRLRNEEDGLAFCFLTPDSVMQAKHKILSRSIRRVTKVQAFVYMSDKSTGAGA